MKTKLPTKAQWEKAAKILNFKDNRIPKKLEELERIEVDAYQDGISCLADLRFFAKTLPAGTKNAAGFLTVFLQTVDKEQGRLVKAKSAAKVQQDNILTPQEAAQLIKKVKFSGLQWDPKRTQQAHQAIDKAITASHWNAYSHFAKRVLERGPKYHILNGDDLQAAIQAGRSEPEEEGKFNHKIPHGGLISYNPSSRTIITLV